MGENASWPGALVEQGVRFVQLYAGTWDSHDYIEKAHGTLIHSVDKPMAALITDLKQRGLLDETFNRVVWRVGRSPDNASAVVSPTAAITTPGP